MGAHAPRAQGEAPDGAVGPVRGVAGRDVRDDRGVKIVEPVHTDESPFDVFPARSPSHADIIPRQRWSTTTYGRSSRRSGLPTESPTRPPRGSFRRPRVGGLRDARTPRQRSRGIRANLCALSRISRSDAPSRPLSGGGRSSHAHSFSSSLRLRGPAHSRTSGTADAPHTHGIRANPLAGTTARRRDALGVRFRRQIILGPFVVDFFAPSHGLAVEVDGPVHQYRRDVDRLRDEALEARGLRVLRIEADLVEGNLAGALCAIRSALLGAG